MRNLYLLFIRMLALILMSNFAVSEEKTLKDHFSLDGEVVGESAFNGLVENFNLSFIDGGSSALDKVNHICLLSMTNGKVYEINLYFDVDRGQKLNAYTVSEQRKLTSKKCVSVEVIDTMAYTLIGLTRDEVQLLLGAQDSNSTANMWIYVHSWPTYTLDPNYSYSSVAESENLELQYFEVGTLKSVVLGVEFDKFDKVAVVRMSSSDEIIYSVKEVNIK